ncbi:MAG TPA: hypothetical protein VKT77_14240, partial [Chthonomonadaceae bacterium]|nr:hypothetical protein [Chthonomonadaceae bacterium]
ATAKWTPGAHGDDTITVTIPSVPVVASEDARLHFRFRAQLKRGNALEAEEWVDKDFPSTSGAGATAAPNRTNEPEIVTSSQPRTITLTVPPAANDASTDLNSLVLTATRVEDPKLQAPESFNVTLQK